MTVSPFAITAAIINESSDNVDPTDNRDGCAVEIER